jgi:uracil-DNA glycosylase
MAMQSTSYSPNLKLKTRSIGQLDRPVFLVGINPGHNRDGTHTGTVWEKNRSARLLNEAIEGLTNLYFTNVSNYTTLTDEHLREGLSDLKKDISLYKPSKIVCLGKDAFGYVSKLDAQSQIIRIAHPSYIARFNKDKEMWIKMLRFIVQR